MPSKFAIGRFPVSGLCPDGRARAPVPTWPGLASGSAAWVKTSSTLVPATACCEVSRCLWSQTSNSAPQSRVGITLNRLGLLNLNGYILRPAFRALDKAVVKGGHALREIYRKTPPPTRAGSEEARFRASGGGFH